MFPYLVGWRSRCVRGEVLGKRRKIVEDKGACGAGVGAVGFGHAVVVKLVVGEPGWFHWEKEAERVMVEWSGAGVLGAGWKAG